MERTADTYINVVRRNQPHMSRRKTFQTQVLALLGSLQSDTQSMGDRISRLERTQSVPPDITKGKGKGKAPPRNSGEKDRADRRLHDDHRAQQNGS